MGRRIKQRIDELGISQSELARRVKLHPSTINGLIRGSSDGSSKIHVIAHELHTTPAFLTGETDDPGAHAEPDALTSQERQWVDIWRSLETPDRRALLHVAQALAQRPNAPALHSPQLGFHGAP